MRKSILRAAAAGALLAAGAVSVMAAQPAHVPPAWAFPVNPPDKHSESAVPPDKIEHVPGSTLGFTDRQLNNAFFAADWFPNEHPPLPPVVEFGRKPLVMACGYCHLPTGTGGPAEAALPGLPARYIVQQIGEFRAGRRRAAQALMISANDMVKEVQHLSPADIRAAADFFSQLPFKSHFHVVETDIVPRTSVLGVSVYGKIAGGGTEPIGARIVEIPNDMRQWELGDPHTEFTAYVPKGSIRRGQALVASGDGAAPCRNCHGADLRGAGPAPPIAGRSASYLARQLYDIQYGTRSGPVVAPMLSEVAHMSDADRIAIAAYLTSLPG